MVRSSMTSNATQFISDTTHEPSGFTASTYATCPAQLSHVTMIDPTFGVGPTGTPWSPVATESFEYRLEFDQRISATVIWKRKAIVFRLSPAATVYMNGEWLI